MPHSDYAVSNLQCPSKNDCVIIGLDDVSQISQVKYAQTWQNAKWGAPHFFSQSQLGKGFATMIFDALSCPSTTWCIGAGQFEASSGRSSPFSVTMHNGEWSHLTLLKGYHESTNNNGLNSISCGSIGNCVATGVSRFGTGNEASVPLIMSESGGKWAPPSTLSIPGVTSPQLDPTLVPLVSCVRNTQCTGVITLRATDGLVVGVATLRGASHWSVVRLTDLGQFTYPSLQGLWCSKSDCVAVGTGDTPAKAGGFNTVPLVVTAKGSW